MNQPDGQLTTVPPDTGADRPADLRFADVSSALPILPGYEMLNELGRGGMGVVYRARELRLNRLVALKMILAGVHAGPDDLARFRREAEALARLAHPHIVTVHAIDEHEGRPYFSLEYCSGGTLAEHLSTLSARQSAEMLEKLARAMHDAHSQGVIHRDLKPVNVLMTADGTPKITDFGLARKLDEAGQTRTGSVMGTPSYMAPEQASGSKVLTPSVDVYSLGAILYECLTGRPPFQAATTVETVLQVLHEDPVAPREINPAIPRDLEAICLKCLEKSPKQRYANAQSLADDLRRFLDGEPISVQQNGLLGQLAGAMERVQLQEKFAAYGALLLCLAPVMFLPEVIVTLALCYDWPISAVGAAQYGRMTAFLLVLGAYRKWHWMPNGPIERQLWAVWGGYLVSCLAAGISVRLSLGFIATGVEKHIYPYFALLTALAFFAMSANFWGYCAVIGLGWALLSWVMVVDSLWAPLEFGTAWGIVLVLLGLRLRQLGKTRASP
ncbi:MAG: serine/threonine protein kinase [Planctomycetia bacterium]|nr:serine/threonine protein kinase [Planctomycetia bacterium]